MGLYPDLVREAVKKLGDRAGLVAIRRGRRVATPAAAAAAAAGSPSATVSIALIGM